MELRQLEYFVAVAEEGSFTKAAARVRVAQPGVSAQIRRLERELGDELLERQPRTVRLTEVGAAVLPYARAALEAVAGARLAVDELTGLFRGQVTVGMVVACSALDVTDVIAGFHRAHPGVEISLSEANSDRLFEMLLAGELDVAFAAFGAATPLHVETQVIADEPLVAAVSPDHPLAGRKTIALTGLRDHELISLPVGTGMRSALENASQRAGFVPQIAFEASDPEMLAELASRGLGVAILAEPLARRRAGDLHAIAITRPPIRAGLALAWRREGPTSPAARAMISHARAALANQPAPDRNSMDATASTRVE